MPSDVERVESLFRESRAHHVRDGPRIPGAAIHDGPDVFWARRGEPNPLANIAFNGEFADPDAGVAEVTRGMGGLPFVWCVREGAFEPVRDALRRAGFVKTYVEREMVLGPQEGRAPTLPSGLSFRRVEDEAGLRRYQIPATAAFRSPPDTEGSWLTRILSLLPHGRMLHFVGELKGEPVACGTTFLGSQTAGLYGIGVAPGFQNRGIGAAMTWRLVDAARAAGRPHVGLGASREGAAVYARVGFRDIAGLEEWSPPPAKG